MADTETRLSILDRNTITSLGVVGSIALIILPLTFWLGGNFNKSSDQDKVLAALTIQISETQKQISELKGFMQAQAFRDESQTSSINQIGKTVDKNAQNLSDHETRIRILELKKSP